MRQAPCRPKRSPPWLERTRYWTGVFRPSVCGFGVALGWLLEDRRRLEHHDPARRNRNLLAGLGITADPLTLIAHNKGTERGKLHRLAALERVGDLLKHQFNKRRGLCP